MKNLLLLFNVPSAILIVSLTCGIILLVFVLIVFGIKRKIKKYINFQIEKWNLNRQKSSISYPDWILLFFSTYIEKLSIRNGINLPVILGLDELWIKQVRKNGKKKIINKVLKYSPDKGLFAVMKSVIKKRKLQYLLLEWIDKSGEFMVLRKIALSGNGEYFDGQKALLLFEDKMDEINEMLGDYEWKSRYFAINILIYNNSERSKAAVWDSFRDPSVFVRISSVKLFNSDNREEQYNILQSLILNDPSFEVRKAARIRISSDFQDLYKIDPFEFRNQSRMKILLLNL